MTRVGQGASLNRRGSVRACPSGVVDTRSLRTHWAKLHGMDWASGRIGNDQGNGTFPKWHGAAIADEMGYADEYGASKAVERLLDRMGSALAEEYRSAGAG